MINKAVVNLSPDEQKQVTSMFLTMYFSPWDDEPHSAETNAKVLAMAKADISRYLQRTNWQFTYQIFPADKLKSLIENADLNGFPQIDRPAIIVHVTQARIFPTLLPAYNDPQLAGEGYPFDNWINSYVYPGTPVRILQRSKDHLWYLIKTASYYGWVPCHDLGFVTEDFISGWKKHTFVVALQDGQPLYNNQSQVLEKMRKGVIYPMVADQQGDQTQILIPILANNGEAKGQTVMADKAGVHIFPIPANSENIASFANSFIGGQYGWGDLYELRDCSSTTSNILASFGLWLPRNSHQQAMMGDVISLANMSRQAKLKIFSKQAVPFFTLVHFPGHIGIYVGMRHGQPYVLQDIWGIRTHDLLGREGRGIIGKTVILPLYFPFSNSKTMQIDSADSLSILTPASYLDEQKIRKNVWP